MIAGAGPFVLNSPGRPARWAIVSVVAAVSAWAGGGLYDRFDTQRRAEQARALDLAAREAEHAAFTDVVGIREDKTIEVARGETLAAAIRRAGAQTEEVRDVVGRLSEIFDARKVRPGQTVDVFFESDGARARLTGLAFRSQPGAAITVNRTFDGAFRAREVLMPLTFEVSHVRTAIQTSLYSSALENGATDKEVSQLADIFAYDVDFQRDIRRGDAFEMVFERLRDDLGETVKTEALLYAALTVHGKNREFYRFQRPGETTADYYDAEGRSARKFLMKTPINGARLSSGFGFRRHPILGYSLLHKGTDFAARTGTPIMAAGDGVVVKAGPNGSYGNYVRIRHGDGYETAYAHMSRYGSGIRAGARVTQGQVVGFVGTTGRSTGPHLHYEVLHKNAHVNPMQLKVRTGRNLEAKELVAFKAEVARIDELRKKPHIEAAAPNAAAVEAKLTQASASGAADLRGAFR
jgi:murein DD-endopeptidase MepM/ murein hydrolase activator NlpD